MIDYDSMSFNELISGQIMRALAMHDPQYAELSHDQVANRVTRYCFMGAIAKINGLPFFPKVAEFCDASLHAYCDPTVLTRGLFSPLWVTGDKLVVAVANPWSPLPDEYLAPRFPDLEIVKIVTLASEIARAIESVATNSGPSRSELEAIDVEDNGDDIRDFDVTTDYTEPMAQLVATVMADAVKGRASDIHFKVEKESFYYAYRVDGDIGPRLVADEDHFIGRLRILTLEQHTVVAPPPPGTAIKRMSLLRRRADVSPEVFAREWQAVHGPLVMRQAGVLGYRQNRVTGRQSPKGCEVGYEGLPIDGIVELWFADAAAIDAAFGSPEGRETMAHAQTFIGEITTFLVEPVIVQ